MEHGTLCSVSGNELAKKKIMQESRCMQIRRKGQRKYNTDEIGQRILNGDGGVWIKEFYDPEVIFQLNRYHIYQEILRKIRDKEAQEEIRRLFDAEKPDEKDTKSKKAMELYKYLNNNRDGLLPYDKQGKEIPKPPAGVMYKGMGVQENQNCTVITLRIQEIVETLSAAKAPKNDGKGNPYVDVISTHMPLLEAMQTASGKVFKGAFCNS